MGTRLDPTANERTAYIDSLCQILTYVRRLEEVGYPAKRISFDSAGPAGAGSEKGGGVGIL